MRSRHLLDPQLVPLLELPSSQLSADTLLEVREAFNARPVPPISYEGLKVYEEHVPGHGGAPDVRLLITAPDDAEASRPAIYNIHGGGYIVGTADINAPIDAVYARQLGAVVVSVDYRLAPEAPHPGPVEDCYAGLSWLHAHADRLHVDRKRICVSGESAGGGLAASLVLLARDRGEIPIAFQHLICPMLDDRTAVDADPCAYVGEFIWTRDQNAFGWASLLGQEPGSAEVSQYASPARAADLTNLPPTFIGCGAIDLFAEENIDYARRLIRAGVPTELHIYPGSPHGFQYVPEAHVSKAFTRDSLSALERGLVAK